MKWIAAKFSRRELAAVKPTRGIAPSLGPPTFEYAVMLLTAPGARKRVAATDFIGANLNDHTALECHIDLQRVADMFHCDAAKSKCETKIARETSATA